MVPPTSGGRTRAPTPPVASSAPPPQAAPQQPSRRPSLEQAAVPKSFNVDAALSAVDDTHERWLIQKDKLDFGPFSHEATSVADRAGQDQGRARHHRHRERRSVNSRITRSCARSSWRPKRDRRAGAPAQGGARSQEVPRAHGDDLRLVGWPCSGPAAASSTTPKNTAPSRPRSSRRSCTTASHDFMKGSRSR